MILKFDNTLSRYSEYAFVSRKERSYILPLLTAEKTEYDPSDTVLNALLDILRIGCQQDKGKEITEAVLAFCSCYGFLGFTKIHLSFRDYSRGRFPEWNRSPVAFSPKEFENELKWQTNTFRRRYDKEPDYEIAEKYNCAMYEQPDSFVRLGCWLLDLSRRISEGRQIEMYLDSTPTIHFDEGQPKTLWHADCLAGAMLICFYLAMTESPAKIRLCKRCGKPFYTANARTEYCSALCRNVANVKASRSRRRAKEKAD